MTKEQIYEKVRLIDPLTAAHMYCATIDYWINKPLDAAIDANNEGKLPDPFFKAYCYLWRNMVYRFSNELIQYELKD